MCVLVCASIRKWLVGKPRWVGYRGYYRLVAANYANRWLATKNETPAGTFRSYDLLPRHRSDPMLAELDETAGTEAVIYDLGANVGIYSLALAADSPERRLFAVEADPRTRSQLRANVSSNGLGDQIETVGCGVGEMDGSRQFYRSTYPECSGFTRESATRWEATVAETTEVAVRRLDTLAANHSPPDAIKLDVEGAEPAVLRGGRETLETYQPTLFIEIHQEGLSADTAGAVGEQLEARNYQILKREDYWRCVPQS